MAHRALATCRITGMSRFIGLMIALVSSGIPIFAQDPAPVAPREWVAFSADVRIEMPKPPEAWGRYVQDEHGEPITVTRVGMAK